jgi:hypothetical protein
MKRLLLSGVFVMLAFMFVGCASTIVNYELIALTNNPVGSKVGETSLLPVGKFGTTPAEPSSENGGIYQAAKNGDISKIAVVEKRTTNHYSLFGGYTKVDIVVSGE